MRVLFISDLHLSGNQPATLQLFLEFLEGPARSADALYILGDLFEVWLGDDLVLPEYQPVLEALRKLAAQGCSIWVMRGNRDFLLGGSFEAMSGCRLLPEPAMIELGGQAVLLLHGDTLCTDDQPYQKLRAQLRNPQWIDTFLGNTPEERIAFARQLRDKSREATREKEAAIMDVNAETVAETLTHYGTKLLIHGHTHRPAIHTFSVNGETAQRMVLGDWQETGSVLEWDAAGFELGRYPASP